MRDDTIEWQHLNAYADGELPDGEARLLENRLAADPDLQRELAGIREVKRKLARLRPYSAEIAPPPARAAVSPRKAAAIAASFIVAAVLSAIVGVFLLGSERTNWVEYAQALHGEQSHQAYVVEARYVAQTVSSGHALEFRAPDLTASRLYLVDIATPRWNDREAIAMHYRGVHGCRLTIVAVQASDGDVGAPDTGASESLIRTWIHEGFVFAVIANGMDPDRFAAVADYSQAAIVEAIGQDRQMRTAMVESHRSAQPCA